MVAGLVLLAQAALGKLPNVRWPSCASWFAASFFLRQAVVDTTSQTQHATEKVDFAAMCDATSLPYDATRCLSAG